MKRLVISFFIIFFSLLGANGVSAGGESYMQDYAFCEVYGVSDTCRVVQIEVPNNIEYFEYLFMTNQIRVDSYEFRLIWLNTLLIKKWYDSIY